MRLRLVGLLVVAGACTWLAASVSTASAEKAPVRAPARAQPVRRSAVPCPLRGRYRPVLERAAADTGLPLALLVAVARVESNRPRARSELALRSGQPPSNVLAGARYLALMLDRFHSTDLGLAAYDAGPTAVARAGGAPSAATLTYVAKVTRLWRKLNGCT